MSDFSTRYQPPGVYFEEQESTLAPLVGITPTVVAIVGPALGYRIETEKVSLFGTTPVELARTGIFNDATLIVRLDDGTVVAADQYAVVQTAGENLTLPHDNPTTLARAAGSVIPDGARVTVTYRYADERYFQPRRFTNYDDLTAVYGEPLAAGGAEIQSPVSMAGFFAFTNGAAQVMVVPTAGSSVVTSRAELLAAYPKLLPEKDVSIVVPLPVGLDGADANGVGIDLLAHLEAALVEHSRRIGIIGFETDVTTTPTTIAAAFRSPRIMMVWPNSLLYFSSAARRTLKLPGYYLAAAYAGLFAGMDPEQAATRKVISGFTDVPPNILQQMTRPILDSYSEGGVCVTERNRDGNLVCRHGVTTDTSSIDKQEMSVVRGQDAMLTLLDTIIERSGIIGSPIDPETPLRVRGLVSGGLESLVAAGTINSYQNLAVRQLSLNPTVMEVKWEYLPSYPLNYVSMIYTINVTTGESELQLTAA